MGDEDEDDGPHATSAMRSCSAGSTCPPLPGGVALLVNERSCAMGSMQWPADAAVVHELLPRKTTRGWWRGCEGASKDGGRRGSLQPAAYGVSPHAASAARASAGAPCAAALWPLPRPPCSSPRLHGSGATRRRAPPHPPAAAAGVRAQPAGACSRSCCRCRLLGSPRRRCRPRAAARAGWLPRQHSACQHCAWLATGACCCESRRGRSSAAAGAPPRRAQGVAQRRARRR